MASTLTKKPRPSLAQDMNDYLNLICESSRNNDNISLPGWGSKDDSIPEIKIVSFGNICVYMNTNLSISYLGAAMCIISTAQHANPNVRGHKEPFLRRKVLYLKIV